MYVTGDGLRSNLGRAADLPPTVCPPAPSSNLGLAMLRSRLQCSDVQVAAIKGALGPGADVTGDGIAKGVARAYDGIYLDLTDPDLGPRPALLRPIIPAATTELFTAAFGEAPTKLPWPGAKKNLGWIVGTRLGGAREAMFSCSLRISCWGWPWSGGGGDRPMDYMVKALPKQERVALGALFWRAVAQSDRDSMAGAILAAGLVIRYGVSYETLAKPLSNLHCYIKYALTMRGRPVPPWVTAKCPVTK